MSSAKFLTDNPSEKPGVTLKLIYYNQYRSTREVIPACLSANLPNILIKPLPCAGSVLGAKDTMMNKKDKVHALLKPII